MTDRSEVHRRCECGVVGRAVIKETAFPIDEPPSAVLGRHGTPHSGPHTMGSTLETPMSYPEEAPFDSFSSSTRDVPKDFTVYMGHGA